MWLPRTTPHQYITKFSSLAYSDNVAYPIPANPLFEQGCNDHHMEIIDVDEMVLYELYAVTKQADGYMACRFRGSLGS